MPPATGRFSLQCVSRRQNITSFSVGDSPALSQGQRLGSVRPDTFNVRDLMAVSRDCRFLFCDRGVILRLGR
jgi:hypothetical protein